MRLWRRVASWNPSLPCVWGVSNPSALELATYPIESMPQPTATILSTKASCGCCDPGLSPKCGLLRSVGDSQSTMGEAVLWEVSVTGLSPHFSPQGMTCGFDAATARPGGRGGRRPGKGGTISAVPTEKRGKNQRWGWFSPCLARGFSAEHLTNLDGPARWLFSSGKEPMSAAWPASSDTPVGTLLHRGSPRPEPPRPSAPSRESAPRSSATSNGSCRIGPGPWACP